MIKYMHTHDHAHTHMHTHIYVGSHIQYVLKEGTRACYSCAHMHAQLRRTLWWRGIICICALSLSAWILNLFLYSEVTHHGSLEAGNTGLWAVRYCGCGNDGPSVESPELTNVLPLKPQVGQNVAVHASPTARNFFPVQIVKSIHILSK